MKLFFYYIVHSAKNSLKKLFKTWVVVLFAVMVAGGLLIGGTIGIILKKTLPEAEKPGIEQEVPDSPDPRDEVPVMDILELAAGGVILIVFTLGLAGADKSGAEIFQPADVTLLFPSPMKPQSVLMFRTMTQIGASVAVSIYFLAYQIPNLSRNAGFDAVTVLAIIAGWILMLGISQLLKMLCFVFCSTHPVFKRNLRRIIFLFLALIACGFYLFRQRSGLGWWEAVLAFFNAPSSRYIPFWGWIKGFVMFTAERDLRWALAMFAAALLGGAFLAWLTWHMKADFYEEALQKATEKAELLAAAKDAESGSGIMKRKKDRSERIRRNQFDRGWGAGVFFWKSVYNRFRFAHFGFLTKTMEFYLVSCIAAALVCRLAVHTVSALPVVVLLAVFAFYRSLGNSLREDTQMWYFHMIPEDAWLKLLCSLGGDMLNGFLDTLPALLIALLIQGAPLFPALLWFPAVLSVTAYATSVGTFIDMSTGVNAGKMLKQMIQIIFIYFGLLPDLAAGGILIALKLPLLAALAVTLINTALSLLFLYLASLNMGKK